MRLLPVLAVPCASLASLLPAQNIPLSEYRTRREALRKDLNGTVVLFAKTVGPAIKPGAKYDRGENSVTIIAKDSIDSHGTDLHDEPLEAGMIFTVEPGIYIPEESIGIRIEDVVLVTDNGAKILSAALPREADEVEKALAK
jgi:hypothetical protein